jgi:hypothetical protein
MRVPERAMAYRYEDATTEDVQKAIRDLRRQLRKAEARYAELARAYQLTVDNLVKTTSECGVLERERDWWQRRAQERSTEPTFGAGKLALSSEEIGAIRKAVARLHHPDTGGDGERLKAWNTLLDALQGEAG